MSENSYNNNNSDPTFKGDPLSDSNDAAQSRKKITSQNKPFTLLVILICGLSISYLSLKFISLKNDIKNFWKKIWIFDQILWDSVFL